MAEITGWQAVPSILRHCVVAVYRKTTGGGPDGVVRAFKICRDQLAKQGYLYHRGQAEILENIQVTGKGFVRSLHHSHEGSAGAAKDNQFKQLFQMIEPRLWEYDGPGGRSPPKDMAGPGSDFQDQERSKLVDSRETMIDFIGVNHLAPANKPPKK